jgi:hypothetical protein
MSIETAPRRPFRGALSTSVRCLLFAVTLFAAGTMAGCGDSRSDADGGADTRPGSGGSTGSGGTTTGGSGGTATGGSGGATGSGGGGGINFDGGLPDLNINLDAFLADLRIDGIGFDASVPACPAGAKTGDSCPAGSLACSSGSTSCLCVQMMWFCF